MAPSIVLPDTYAKQIVSAINYEVHSVDEFVLSSSSLSRGGQQQHRRGSTNSVATASLNSDAENLKSTTSLSSHRRSTREKQKKELTFARARVRYDMQFVPTVQRNKAFLQSFPVWWKAPSSTLPAASCRASNCESCENLACKPFLNDDTVVWIPSKRSEWDDTISELTGVCTSAAFRRHFQSNHPAKKPFYPPLSKEYIRDRVDIDDPLRGYQLRHKTGGWLQGFVLWTNFTTWTYSYRWDSLNQASGVPAEGAESNSLAIDRDGSLAMELEGLPRAGDPHGGGIIFPDIAEIGLVGALGCGEYLLRMTLDAIRSAGSYRYVVLQATNASKTFYERYGFVRVGAVCTYNQAENEMVGYRHWTHANESNKSLELHGGPSYMMCLKLPTAEELDACAARTRSRDVSKSTFLEEMLKYAVNEKPRITQVGGPWSPAPSQGQNSGLKRNPGRPRAVPQGPMTPIAFGKRALVQDGDDLPPSKRRRINSVSSDEISSLESGKGSSGFPKKRGRPRKNSLGSFGTSVAGKTRGRPPKSTRVVQPDIAVSAPSRSRSSSRPPRPVMDEGPRETNSLHSVRGNNGRFSQSPYTKTDQMRALQNVTAPINGVSSPVDKKTLVKQRVKSYPRSKLHYYNRVVQKKGDASKFYFVLNYNESTDRIIIVPMEARGVLTGKREGKPRYQAVVGNSNENFIESKADKYNVVRSTMVMKTPIVAQEAWDIETD